MEALAVVLRALKIGRMGLLLRRWLVIYTDHVPVQVNDADEWSAEGASRVSAQYEGKFWQESCGREQHKQQQEANDEASVIFVNGNTFSKSSFKFSNNAGPFGDQISSSSFSRADQAVKQQLAARRRQEATGGHSCILFIQMELCSSTLRCCSISLQSASQFMTPGSG